MCDPGTLTLVGLTVASGISQANAQYQQSMAQVKMYDYQAATARQQAKLETQRAESQANRFQDQAKAEGRNLSEDQARFSASQRAILAANGIIGVTAEDIVHDTVRTQQMDQLQLRLNADQHAADAIQQGKYNEYALLSEARGYEYAAKNTKAQAKRQVFNTLLGTAASSAAIFSAGGGFGRTGNIGPGTTSYGIQAPSRYIPPR